MLVSYDLLRKILEQMVESGELRFGFNTDIKEFVLLSYVIHDLVDLNANHDDIMCTCEYMEDESIRHKSVLISKSKLRDNKLGELGI